MSLVIQFLTQIRQHVRNQDGDALRAWLQVNPDAGRQYNELAGELRSQYRQEGLEKLIDNCLPEEEDAVDEGKGSPWSSFNAFIKEYLGFWRDVDYDDLVTAHELLLTLVHSCATAFTNPTQGGMLLQTSISLSDSLARVTMALNRRPDLLRRVKGGGGGDEQSPAGRAAKTIERIFTTCLQDRTTDRYTKPGGKKVAVYVFINLELKLLFACRHIKLATMLLTQIAFQGPLLSLYPAAQRVTFLYYLGRYWFANNHFLRAANCLQEAYLQTPQHFASHRTKILTHLIPSNIMLGRFPSAQLLQRSEAQSLAPVFQPLCAALRAGNFMAFQHHLAEHESWLFEKGLLLPLSYKLRPMLWRSLSRKVFLLTYTPPTDATSRSAATLDLADLHAAATFCQRRLEGWLPADPSSQGHHHRGSNPLLMKAIKNSASTVPVTDSTLAPPPGGPRKLRPNEGMVWGNAEVTFDDVELMVSELCEQGLMHGYVAHGLGRFAIMGGRAKGPVVAGWPTAWQAIQERSYDDGDFDLHDVPGWVKG